MKTNTKWLIICIGLVVIGFLLYAYQGRVLSDTPTQRSPFTVDRGYLVKDGKGMEQGVWYLQYEKQGNQDGALIKVSFTDSSLCSTGTLITKCDPQSFAQGQGVQIEGLVKENQIEVANLIVLNERLEE